MSNIPYTTLAGAPGAGDRRLEFASGTNLAVGKVVIFNDEAVTVRKVPGSSVYADVFRGQLGTKARAHAAGDRAWIADVTQLAASRPQGVASATAYTDLPRIVLPDAKLGIFDVEVWVPFGSEWLRVNEPGFSARIRTIRKRFTIAEVNAGAEILPAIYGYAYRMIGARALAYGGAAGAVTTVDIIGTLSASTRKLVAYAQASLTQSTVLRDGITGGAVLADGASYVVNDPNTAISIGKTGGNVTTATGIDVEFDYVIELA